MSDEFLKVATGEINEELKEIKKHLDSCSSDADIPRVSESLQENLHKIKGLAPMMGKRDLGDLAALDELLLKKLNISDVLPQIHQVLSESHEAMKKVMAGDSTGAAKLKEEIKTKYLKFLD